MDPRRLRPAEWLLAAAAVLLLVATFLPWYSAGTRTFSAWEAFTVIDIVLLICALVALLAVVLQATQRTPALPVVSDVAATYAGLLATVLTIIKLIDPPSVTPASLRLDALTTDWGAWVGLVAAVGTVTAGWLAMRDERPGGARASHLESSR